jgi:hypothetical protein
VDSEMSEEQESEVGNREQGTAGVDGDSEDSQEGGGDEEDEDETSSGADGGADLLERSSQGDGLSDSLDDITYDPIHRRMLLLASRLNHSLTCLARACIRPWAKTCPCCRHKTFIVATSIFNLIVATSILNLISFPLFPSCSPMCPHFFSTHPRTTPLRRNCLPRRRK